jgi:hypothetical protein
MAFGETDRDGEYQRLARRARHWTASNASGSGATAGVAGFPNARRGLQQVVCRAHSRKAVGRGVNKSRRLVGAQVDLCLTRCRAGGTVLLW